MASLILFPTGSLPDDGEITMQFSVDNMTCGHCVRAITAALQDLDAHAQVDVDLLSGRVQTAIGRASCRERVSQTVKRSEVAVYLKKKKKSTKQHGKMKY